MVHTWDMRTRRCLRRDIDEGCLTAAALALAPRGRLYATGADSGVVNVYRRGGPPAAGRGGEAEDGVGATDGGKAASGAARPCPARAAAPARAITNLTTVADTLAFSPDSQARQETAARFLAMCLSFRTCACMTACLISSAGATQARAS